MQAYLDMHVMHTGTHTHQKTHILTSCLFLSCGEIDCSIPVSFTCIIVTKRKQCNVKLLHLAALQIKVERNVNVCQCQVCLVDVLTSRGNSCISTQELWSVGVYAAVRTCTSFYIAPFKTKLNIQQKLNSMKEQCFIRRKKPLAVGVLCQRQ